ncbi:hypothetical protein [Chlamydiifrater phoenicopteri]|uniref:hypothetical protein n=1 Tax=Chlamydiifrater phoenicopteri TaxID=2681469 RepID=UPI001BCDE133|nr:hypothetical protein [Chlamydiifrater phoenicopteri]
MSSIQHLKNRPTPESNPQDSAPIAQQRSSLQRALTVVTIVLAILVGAATVASAAILCPTTPFVILTLAIVSSLATIILICCVLDRQRPTRPIPPEKPEPVELKDIKEKKPPAPPKAPELEPSKEPTPVEPIKKPEPEKPVAPVEKRVPKKLEEPQFNYKTIQKLLSTNWILELTEEGPLYRSTTNENLCLVSKLSPVYDPRNAYQSPEQIQALQTSVVWVQETSGAPNLGRGSKMKDPELPKNLNAIRISEQMREAVSDLCLLTTGTAWLTSGQTIFLPYVDPTLYGPKAMVFTRFSGAPENFLEIPSSMKTYTTQYKTVIDLATHALAEKLSANILSLTIRLPVMGLSSLADPTYKDEATLQATSFMTRIALLQAIDELNENPDSKLSRISKNRLVTIELCDEDFPPLGPINEGTPAPVEEEWTKLEASGE